MIRLRLLALVLALALTSYALNPASVPVRRVKRGAEPPDEKRREVKSLSGLSHKLPRMGANIDEATTDTLSPVEEVDIEDLEWPDVIDFT